MLVTSVALWKVGDAFEEKYYPDDEEYVPEEILGEWFRVRVLFWQFIGTTELLHPKLSQKFDG